jgi:DNA polymerase III epsilon subunit family exonuclease
VIVGTDLNWRPRGTVEDPLELLTNRLECSSQLAEILAVRGFQDPARAQSFLDPDESQFHNPYDLARSESAAESILDAVRENRHIQLIGEHSLDGQIATALLYRLVHQLNGDVSFSIRDEDGYSTPLESRDNELTVVTGRPPGSTELLEEAGERGEAIVMGRKLSEFEEHTGVTVVDPLDRASRYLNHTIPITGLALNIGEIVLRKKYGEEPPNFVAVDLETTGTTASQDEIIEIGAVRFRRGNPVDEFQTFVSSVDQVPEVIQGLTGLSAPDLNGAPGPSEALESFVEFLNGELLVAHNAPFDAGFLHFSMKKYLGEPFLNDYDDSKELARTKLTDLPEHSLKQVCQRLGVDMGTHHRALDDAYSCGEIYVQLRSANPGPIKNFRRRYLPFVALAALSGQSPLSPENRAMTRIGLDCLNRSPFEGFQYVSRRIEEVSEESFGLYRGPLTLLRRAAELEDGEFLVKLFGGPEVSDETLDRLDGLIGDWRQQKLDVKQRVLDSFRSHADPEKRLNVLPVDSMNRYLMDAEITKLSSDLDRSFMVVSEREDNRYEALLRTSESVDLDIILSNIEDKTCLRDEGACSARFTFAEENLSELSDRLNDQLGEPPDSEFHALYDLEIEAKELGELSVDELSRLGPFGPGNSRPRFRLNDVSLVDVEPEGPQSIDLRLGIEKEGTGFEVIAPEMGHRAETVSAGQLMDVVVELARGNRSGKRPETEILVVDMWPAEGGDSDE